MRQVVLDTETTGLSWERGNRVVEIGCIELVERRPTGRQFHRYLNPDRDFEAGAQEVTGLTLDFLADKPRFAQVAEEFLEFVRGAELIIHNAEFDVGFLDSELSRAGAHYGRILDHASVLDSLALARERYPGQRNSLDALCRRLAVDNSHRELHGALLDAQLLAEVYLALTAGQGDLELAVSVERGAAFAEAAPRTRQVLPVVPDAAEMAAHEACLRRIERVAGNPALWREAEADAGAAAMA